MLFLSAKFHCIPTSEIRTRLLSFACELRMEGEKVPIKLVIQAMLVKVRPLYTADKKTDA